MMATSNNGGQRRSSHEATSVFLGFSFVGCCLLIVYLHLNSTSGDIYEGKWDEQSNASIEFISGFPLKVRFCWEKKCFDHGINQSESNMELVWPATKNYPGSTITLQKNGDLYEGEYRVNGYTQVRQFTLTKKQG